MNFQDVYTLQQALDRALPPRLNTVQDHAEHAERQRRLLVAQEDERVMAEWRARHPEDVAYEQAYWARRREEDTLRRREARLDRRRRKALANAQFDLVAAGGQSFFTVNDDRWLDIWLDTSDDTAEENNGDDSDLELFSIYVCRSSFYLSIYAVIVSIYLCMSNYLSIYTVAPM